MSIGIWMSLIMGVSVMRSEDIRSKVDEMVQSGPEVIWRQTAYIMGCYEILNAMLEAKEQDGRRPKKNHSGRSKKSIR